MINKLENGIFYWLNFHKLNKNNNNEEIDKDLTE